MGSWIDGVMDRWGGGFSWAQSGVRAGTGWSVVLRKLIHLHEIGRLAEGARSRLRDLTSKNDLVQDEVHLPSALS